MSVNSDLLEILMDDNQKNTLEYILYLNNETYPITDVSVEHSVIPVNKPTTRGGVYFSDKFAYKMKGTINDLAVVPLLTKKMLGPNTEFAELRISTKLRRNKTPLDVEIFTNLTNSVQTPAAIELSMIIVKLESV